MTWKFNASDELIDTREIIDRIGELESEYWDEATEDTRIKDLWSADDRAEWTQLSEIIEEVGDEARYGVTLVSESYFTEYIKNQYHEIGPEYHQYNGKTHRYDLVSLDKLFQTMPFSCIDWDRVAEDDRSDFFIYEWDDVTFYYESC